MNKGDRQILSAKYGEIFINGEKLLELKSAEIKLSMNYVDVEVAGDHKPYRKYDGYEISGSITVNKIDSKFSKIMLDTVKNGYAPDIRMQSILTDKAFKGSEAIALYGVTFDEITITKIDKGGFEQELPFKASSIEAIETLE